MYQIPTQQAASLSNPIPQFESRWGMKRIGDLVISCAAIAFSLPLLAIIALSIKLYSGGPVLVREERRLAGGRRIQVLRFRTTAKRRGQAASDPREYPTALGELLHYTRLADLPQLINVLRGDMSFVDAEAAHPDFLD